MTAHTASVGNQYDEIHISGSARAHLGDIYNTAVVDPIDKILDQLSYPGMYDWRSRSIDAHEGTFQWILEDSQKLLSDVMPSQRDEASSKGDVTVAKNKTEQSRKLQDWMRSPLDRNVFWIRGKPGSGKSTLMKTRSQDEKTTKLVAESSTLGAEVIVLTFFAFRAGSELVSRLTGLWRSLIYQVINSCRAVLGNSPTLNGWSEAKFPVASGARLLQALKSLLAEIGKQRTFIMLLDGLDEIADDDHLDMITRVKELTEFAKMCVASRKESIFDNAFGHSSRHLALHDLTAKDIEKVIYSKLSATQSNGQLLDDVDLQTLAKKILSQAEGVFLWVDLVLNSLCRGLNNGDDKEFLEDRLEATPPRD
ncbi:hypothetical protein DOTSEDRAFT_87338 [Dothistroma septosporum NZE10]|uniref:Nephrocystin 3-like N-terminal domain-containing protein n=1 Tax=Dothistroma septosporum (strain NZE10 / CBS 128990) TaxID=675120 RepID=N1PXI0_DOTSN|nr:hypothetical protein DOTSEDRAFT_87338 [Dothistroma septosporum NZE10]